MAMQWNKVTWYSSLSAVILALIIFFVGYTLGSQAMRIKLEALSLNASRTGEPAPVNNSKEQGQTDQQPAAPQSEIAKTTNKLLGSWQSLSNKTQIVVYNSDGTAKVYYSGELGDSFSWELVDSNGQYIKESGASGSRFYKINKLDDENLSLTYTYNSKQLDYQRVR